MSIVISIVARNQLLGIAADLRATKDGVVTDNYQKIYRLTPTIFFGMTGIAENGLKVLEQLQPLLNQTPASLIQRVAHCVGSCPDSLSVMLAGKSSDGGFFIWQKNNNSEETMANIREDNYAFSISGAIGRVKEIEGHLVYRLQQGQSIPEVLTDTVRFASTLDPTISPTSVYYQIQ